MSLDLNVLHHQILSQLSPNTRNTLQCPYIPNAPSHRAILSKAPHSTKQQFLTHNINITNKAVSPPSSLSDHINPWNTKIMHLLQKGDHQTCISLYHQMQNVQISPNSTTLAYVLTACSSLKDLNALRLVHNDIICLGFDRDQFLMPALVDVYLKCGRADLAHQMLDKMGHRDVVYWTMIIRGCNQNGQFDTAILIFQRIISEGVPLDEVALVTILSSITGSNSLKHGMEIHGYAVKKGFDSNETMIGSLANMYTKLGKMEASDRIVHTPGKNVVVWTTMMMGRVRVGDSIGAVGMFLKMMNSGVVPTERTFSCVLRAVSQLGCLRVGTQIHGQVIKRQFKADKFLTSSLINMYTKCGFDAIVSRKLFDEMSLKDVVSWTTMISSFGLEGDGAGALHCFDDMIKVGVHPDSIAFTAVLSSCSSSGMLSEGLKCFDSMVRDHNVRPREEHYSCLMDLISKDGRLQEAFEIVQSLNLRNDGGVWEAFLCSCRVHGNVDLGELAAKRLAKIEPYNSSRYIIMADIYSALGRWEDANNLRRKVKK